MSAAVPGAACLFRFEGHVSAFGRLHDAIGYVLGPWGVAAAVAGLIRVGGNTLTWRVPLLDVFFTLVCGACAVAILEALRRARLPFCIHHRRNLASLTSERTRAGRQC
jgi:hypothetical protein